MGLVPCGVPVADTRSAGRTVTGASPGHSWKDFEDLSQPSHIPLGSCYTPNLSTSKPKTLPFAWLGCPLQRERKKLS